MDSKTDRANNNEKSLGAEYMLFLGTDEKLIYNAKGVFDNTIEGHLVLTDKKLFFYYVSNIARDKILIATHPNLESVKLKDSLFNSSLTINSKTKSCSIKKMNKKDAKELSIKLEKIIKENK